MRLLLARAALLSSRSSAANLRPENCALAARNLQVCWLGTQPWCLDCLGLIQASAMVLLRELLLI